MSYLYILDVKPLLVISFANMFFHSVGCLLILLIVSFAMEKLLSLIRSYISYAFISYAFGRLIYENTAVVYVSYVSPVASQVAKQ